MGGDIEVCFDTIDHTVLMDRVRRGVGDKRVLALVKAFLKAGIFTEDGTQTDTRAGTPQGGILSPLPANVALSVLDEYIARIEGGPSSTQGERAKRERQGKANYRLVWYADDFLVLVMGVREHAEEMRAQVAQAFAPVGVCLSMEKTKIIHIDEGLDFLGWYIQRYGKRGAQRRYVYTCPSRKALRSVMARVKDICRESINLPLPALSYELNPVLGGWCMCFRAGVSSATFQYLGHSTWGRVIKWARREHFEANWKTIRRIYRKGGWWPVSERGELFNPAKVATTRYPCRGTAIFSPWPVSG